MHGSALYAGDVMHQRLDRVGYRFVYRVFSLLLDLDELPSLHRRLRLFSHGRLNLFSLYDRDHGGRDGAALRPWVETLLRGHGVELDGGRILLLCFPRVLGYVFNPMSVWYCHHRDGSLRAVVCEVRNTFGEMHHYVLVPAGGGPMDWKNTYHVDKVFHVSPFIGPQAEYRFRFDAPAERVRIHIGEFADDRLLLQASLSGARVPLTDARLLQLFWRIPLMPFKVMAAIHWQAWKIWLRGGRFHRTPPGGLYTGT